MRPLSGMLLYVNLGFAIIWDSIGFLLFAIGLIPAVQAFAVMLSPVVDILAFLTDLTFCTLYQGYVKLYNVNFRVYQVKRIKDMLRLSKSSGASKNPISQNLARQTQKINQYMTDKFSNYVIDFTVKKIQYSIFTSVLELIPWLGDLSPSWTIKANLHLREHRKTSRELKLRNEEFEKSLAKWRGSLRIGGIGKFKSRKNNNQDVMKTAANNIRPFNRKKPAGAGVVSQSLLRQKDNNQDVRNTAANNIRPFTRQPRAGGQLIQGQSKQLANVQSKAANLAYSSGQLFGNIPQFLEYEDDRLKDKKSSADNSSRYSNKESVSSGGRYMQSPNNNTGQINGERLAGERAQAALYPQDVNPTIRDTAANNIRPFRRKRLAGEGAQAIPRQDNNNKLDNVKSVAGNIASVGRQLAGSIPQSREYEDEELQYRKSSANKNKPIKTQVFSDISKPISYSNNNNLDNSDISNSNQSSNNIRPFTRTQQNSDNSEQILETLIKK